MLATATGRSPEESPGINPVGEGLPRRWATMEPSVDASWWTHDETRKHLRVDARTLAARMHETPPDIEKPWINYGKPTRPYYRWIASKVDRWWIEVNEWRASTSDRTGTACAGATLTGARGAGSARTSRRPAGSSATSSAAPPKDGGGRLATFVKSLNSRTS